MTSMVQQLGIDGRRGNVRHLESRCGGRDLECDECKATIKKRDPLTVRIFRDETSFLCRECGRKYKE